MRYLPILKINSIDKLIYSTLNDIILAIGIIVDKRKITHKDVSNEEASSEMPSALVINKVKRKASEGKGKSRIKFYYF